MKPTDRLNVSVETKVEEQRSNLFLSSFTPSFPIFVVFYIFLPLCWSRNDDDNGGDDSQAELS